MIVPVPGPNLSFTYVIIYPFVTGGPFTLFAPTNQAFAKVPKATLEKLLANKTLLTGKKSPTHYANMSVQYTAIFHGCKNDNFQMKCFDIFLIFAQNKDCGYTLEPPQ